MRGKLISFGYRFQLVAWFSADPNISFSAAKLFSGVVKDSDGHFEKGFGISGDFLVIF